MLTRRHFLAGSASALVLRGAALSSKDRVDRALKGEDTDRPPFSFWHHFLDETKPPETHAKSTLDFHNKFHTDLVKVMSDYAYPKPSGNWVQVRVQDNPFPAQIRALELIRDGLNGKAYFLETIFNPWTVAEKLSSRQEVMALKDKDPDRLLGVLDVIAKSEANHARRAIGAGASGVLLAIANAQQGVLSQADYEKFSQPFDRMVLDAVKGAPLNVLHLHSDAANGDKLYIERFYKGWPAAAINYSLYTDVPIKDVRSKYSGVILAGLDERKYRTLTTGDLKRQWATAQSQAGKRFILSPGCSVPNDSTDAELLRLPRLFAAG